MMVEKRKNGTGMVEPVLFLLTLLSVMLTWILCCKLKATQVYYQLEDDVALSAQSLCLHDRLLAGTEKWNSADVVFYTGIRDGSEMYFSNPGEATRLACVWTYSLLPELLNANFSDAGYVKRYTVDEYRLVNVISGTAYAYEYIHDISQVFSTAETQSYLDLTISIYVELPVFGETVWVKRERIRVNYSAIE